MCSWWQEQASGLAAKVRYYFWHSRGPMLPPWRVRNSDHSPGHQSQQCPVGSKAEAEDNWLWACSSPMRWPNSSYDRSCRDSVSNTLTAWLSSVLLASVMHDLSDRQSQRSHQVRWLMAQYMCSGYMAPEYVVHGHLTEKADVYSFGVLVIEIVTGKRCCESTGSHSGHSLLAEVWTISNSLNVGA